MNRFSRKHNKSFAAVSLCLFLALLLSSFSALAVGGLRGEVNGDVNEDEEVTYADFADALQFAAGLPLSYTPAEKNFDFSGDGDISLRDINFFIRYIRLSPDDDAVEEMRSLRAWLEDNLDYGGYRKELRPIFKRLMAVLDDSLEKSETVLITPEYVHDTYYDEMLSIKEQYNALDDKALGRFNSIANSAASLYKTVLVDYFYDIIPKSVFEILDL